MKIEEDIEEGKDMYWTDPETGERYKISSLQAEMIQEIRKSNTISIRLEMVGWIIISLLALILIGISILLWTNWFTEVGKNICQAMI